MGVRIPVRMEAEKGRRRRDDDATTTRRRTRVQHCDVTRRTRPKLLPPECFLPPTRCHALPHNIVATEPRQMLPRKCCHANVATQMLPRKCCHANVATQMLPRNEKLHNRRAPIARKIFGLKGQRSLRQTPLSPVDLSFLVRSPTLNTLSILNWLQAQRSLEQSRGHGIRESSSPSPCSPQTKYQMSTRLFVATVCGCCLWRLFVAAVCGDCLWPLFVFVATDVAQRNGIAPRLYPHHHPHPSPHRPAHTTSAGRCLDPHPYPHPYPHPRSSRGPHPRSAHPRRSSAGRRRASASIHTTILTPILTRGPHHPRMTETKENTKHNKCCRLPCWLRQAPRSHFQLSGGLISGRTAGSLVLMRARQGGLRSFYFFLEAAFVMCHSVILSFSCMSKISLKLEVLLLQGLAGRLKAQPAGMKARSIPFSFRATRPAGTRPRTRRTADLHHPKSQFRGPFVAERHGVMDL